MSYQKNSERVPNFRFEDREHGEDKEESLKLGYAVPKMVTFILLLPHGNRDTMDFIAEDFISRKEKESREGRYDAGWVDEFKKGLILFREGKEIPRSGTPLIHWNRVLESRRKLLAAKFQTLEDLAAVPDSALGEIGIDGRVIRDAARLDLQAKMDLSPVVTELTDAKETIRRQEEQIEKLSKRLDSLESKKKTKDE